MISFSGAQDGAAKAIQYLSDHFSYPHLLIPEFYDEICECPQAHTHNQVPRIAEQLLCHVKSISALRGGDEKGLPADVTQTIFQALYLSTEEKLRILPLLQIPNGVSIATMRDYIIKRFKDFEMMASALGSKKHKTAPLLPHLEPADITANATALDEDMEQPSDSEEEANHAENEEFEQNNDSKRKHVNPFCLFYNKKGHSDHHWIQYCDLIHPSVKSELQQIYFCTMCLYLKSYGTAHCCKDFYRKKIVFSANSVIPIPNCAWTKITIYRAFCQLMTKGKKRQAKLHLRPLSPLRNMTKALALTKSVNAEII